MSRRSSPNRAALTLLLAALLAGCGPAVQAADSAPPAPAPQAAPVEDLSPARPLVDAAEAVARGLSAAGVDSALVLLRRAVEVDPRYERAVDNLVWLHRFRAVRFGDIPAAYDSAVAHAERLVALNPVRGWYALGRVYWARGEHALAEEALQCSLTLDQDYLPAYLHLGNLYFDLGRHHLGIPLQRRAAQADPQSRHARNLYGFSYFHLRLPELAVQPFDEATALQRDQYNVGGQLAIRMMRGDFADAIAYTDSVSRADPEPAYTWARAGEAHYHGRQRRGGGALPGRRAGAGLREHEPLHLEIHRPAAGLPLCE